jgi:hypothetical protein
MNGYMIHHSDLVLTIFSTSKYCGQNNDSAIVHIDQNRKVEILKTNIANSPPILWEVGEPTRLVRVKKVPIFTKYFFMMAILLVLAYIIKNVFGF